MLLLFLVTLSLTCRILDLFKPNLFHTFSPYKLSFSSCPEPVFSSSSCKYLLFYFIGDLCQFSAPWRLLKCKFHAILVRTQSLYFISICCLCAFFAFISLCCSLNDLQVGASGLFTVVWAFVVLVILFVCLLFGGLPPRFQMKTWRLILSCKCPVLTWLISSQLF